MKPIFVLLATLAVASLFAAPVAAQTNNSTAGDDVQISVGSPDDGEDPCERVERIDANTAICAAEVDGHFAEITIQSQIRQRIVLTDAAGFMQGGEINRQRYIVTDDSPQTLRFRITSHNGFAGVTIDTGEVLYAKPLQKETSLIGGPYDEQDVQLSAIGGALSVAIVSIFVTIRHVTGRADSPERIA